MHIQSNFRVQEGSDISALFSAMKPTAVTFYPADSAIYAQGDAAGPVYFVEFGTVRICRVTADGRRQIIAFHTAGDVFGFEAGHEHDCSAESVDGAGIRVLRTNCNETPTSSLLKLALASLSRAQCHMLVLGRRTANERMAAFLLDLSERQGDTNLVRLPMQRNDIADHLGVTFETVSRILRSLKDQGVLLLRSIHEIEILDRASLEDMCE
jgi:CRP/FNR family nitrogen fixation transcriptional regulator